MANIFSAFSSFGNFAAIGTYILYGGLFLIIALSFSAIFMMLFIKLKEIPIYVIDMVSRRFVKYRGRERRTKSGSKAIYISKIKKWLPQLQQEDKYIHGKKDALFLLKDKNSLYHSVRIPATDEELQKSIIDKLDDKELKDHFMQINNQTKNTILHGGSTQML
jgi:hypothetical protein